LDRFDRAVARLDNFEEVRYPLLGGSAVLTWTWGDHRSQPVVHNNPAVRYAFVSIDEVDELVQVLWAMFKLDPYFFTWAPEAREWIRPPYEARNRFVIPFADKPATARREQKE